MSYLSRIARFNVLNTIRTRSTGIIRNYVIFKSNFTQTRNKSIFNPFKKSNPSVYLAKDKIPSGFELIYRNTMDRYLFLSQVISVICFGLIAVVILTHSDMQQYQLRIENWKNQPKTVQSETYLYITALSFVCVLLQYMVLKMPARIYKAANNKQYIFVFYGNVPTWNKKVVCKVSEIAKLPQDGVLPWKDSRYQVKDNHGVILVENFFRTPADLNVMLGLQRHKLD